MTIQLNGKTPTKICMVQSSRLPAEYQEVEYIQSSGTQYFIVGDTFKTSYKSVLDFQMTATGGDYIPFGVNTGDTPYKKYGVNAYGGYFKTVAGGTSWTNSIAEDTNRHTLTINKSTVTVDGTDYSTNYVNYTYNYGVGVFAYKEVNFMNYYSKNKLYKLDIYDENGIHIHDLVPCYRIADTEIGMYDLVNDTFYTNQGTGTFTKGNDVSSQVEKQIKKIVIFPDGVTEKQIRPASRLPSAYQEVEYIQSSGTQYFIVGTSFKTEYKSVIDLQMTVIGGDYIPLGVHNNAGKRYGIDAYGGRFTVITGGGNWNNTISEDTNRHLFTIDKSTVTVDGTSYSSEYSSYTYDKGIGVFCYHSTQGSSVGYLASTKLYKLDIYDENDTHIYDLVPCYRKQDTEIGMYDLVNDTFYTNAGSGTFTKGPDVN